MPMKLSMIDASYLGKSSKCIFEATKIRTDLTIEDVPKNSYSRSACSLVNSNTIY